MASIFRQKPEPLELRLRMGRWWWLGAWLPVALAIAIVMRESTPRFGADHTSRLLRPLFEAIFGHMRDQTWDRVHMFLRKGGGHVCGYGLVCLAWLRAWLLTLARRVDLPRRAWRAQSAGLAMLGTFLVASADEWHQTFLPNRTGQFSDVLLDTGGAAAMVLAVSWLSWKTRGRSRQRG